MNLLDEMKARQLEMMDYAKAIRECDRLLAILPPTEYTKVLPLKIERRLAHVLLAGFEVTDLKETFGDIFEDDAKLHGIADGAAIAIARGHIYIAIARGHIYIATIYDGTCRGVIGFPYSEVVNVVEGVANAVGKFEAEQAEDACDQCEPAAAI